ncbi:hypothetical protein A7D17_16710 [Xanthomonas floridensis]|uniref:Uncharacterized protein n=1 Tax=Xanthomonas floridensis TaxID=1843580 RepID=A0A1A9MC23_9XANT|nr:hypothetical protein A7D17_16710 [Xanthomonas floridensis]
MASIAVIAHHPYCRVIAVPWSVFGAQAYPAGLVIELPDTCDQAVTASTARPGPADQLAIRHFAASAQNTPILPRQVQVRRQPGGTQLPVEAAGRPCVLDNQAPGRFETQVS